MSITTEDLTALDSSIEEKVSAETGWNTEDLQVKLNAKRVYILNPNKKVRTRMLTGTITEDGITLDTLESKVGKMNSRDLLDMIETLHTDRQAAEYNSPEWVAIGNKAGLIKDELISRMKN